MSDLDDQVRGPAATVRRVGRRRRLAVTGGCATAITLGLLAGVLGIRSRTDGAGRPADTTVATPASTSAAVATVPVRPAVPAPGPSVATGSSTAPGSRADATTTPVGVPAPRNADAFAATTVDGRLEVWTPAGRALTMDAPADCTVQPACRRATDRVSALAITDRSVWYAGRYDSSLWRAPLDGGRPVLVTTVDGAVIGLTVSRDDATAWLVRLPPGLGTAPRLERYRAGVTTAVAASAWAAALSPDGAWLAYTTYTFTGDPSTMGGQLGELVMRNVRTDAERRVPSSPDVGGGEPPFALGGVRWSPDGTRSLVAAGWEGDIDLVVDVATVSAIDHRSGGWSGPSCWVDASTVLASGWTQSMAPEARVRGDVRRVALPGGAPVGFGVDVFGNELACRSDGSAALVDAPEGPGDLVVVRPGGRRTVLGHGYVSVFPG